MLDRRTMLALGGAAGLAAACGGGPPGPATVTLAFAGEPGMNPGPDGADRPVTVSILRLRDAGAFSTAEMFALTGDPAATLPADLVGMDQVAITPGGGATRVVVMEPEATQLGLVALLREPGGRVWRVATPVAPGATASGAVRVGPGGLTLAMG